MHQATSDHNSAQFQWYFPGYETVFQNTAVLQHYLADDLQREPGDPFHRSEGWAACKFGRHNHTIRSLIRSTFVANLEEGVHQYR